MQNDANNIIVTRTDPKEIQAKHNRILVRDGEFDVTATAELFDVGFDPETKRHFFKMGLYYPHRSTRAKVINAIPALKDGKMVGIQPPEYLMTQADFDAILNGEKITVPTHI